MAFGRGSAGLIRELDRAIPERPFTFEFWDGGVLPAAGDGFARADESDGPVFTVRSPQAIAHLLRSPGQLGLGRAYVSGEIEVDDLDGVIRLMNEWRPPELGRTERLALMLAAARAVGLVRPPRRPAAELLPGGRRHSRERDARAVRHHYDVPTDFFALFLDEAMAYSCGFFSRVAAGAGGPGPGGCDLITDPLAAAARAGSAPGSAEAGAIAEAPAPGGGADLEQAQWAKLELTARKLRLRPGMRLLDVGCGWGSFVIHAAREHGVEALGVTLSEPQAAEARRRAAAAGVADRVEVRVADYRDPDLGGAGSAAGSFDAIASIGMVEHVGAVQIDLYAHRLAGLLKPGGLLLNHGISRLRHGDPPPGDFSERYVFPDGETLQLSRVLLALERAGLATLQVEGFGDDYAETLRHWIERLDANLPRAVELAGPERVRVWRLYLRAARNGFVTRSISIYQVLCQAPG